MVCASCRAPILTPTQKFCRKCGVRLAPVVPGAAAGGVAVRPPDARVPDAGVADIRVADARWSGAGVPTDPAKPPPKSLRGEVEARIRAQRFADQATVEMGPPPAPPTRHGPPAELRASPGVPPRDIAAAGDGVARPWPGDVGPVASDAPRSGAKAGADAVGRAVIQELRRIGPPPLPAVGRQFRFGGVPGGAAGAAALRLGRAAVGRTGRRTGSTARSLPPQPEPWPFRRSLTASGGGLVTSLGGGAASSSPTGLLGRALRGLLADTSIYREAATSASLQREAWIVVAAVAAAPFVLATAQSLMGLSFGVLLTVAPAIITALLAWASAAISVQMVCAFWLHLELGFGQVARAMAYAATPGVLQVVPVAGPFLAMWSLVTNTAAITDITGADTVKAILLMLAGIVGGAIAVAFFGPAVRLMFWLVS